jgi:glycerate 2-kinase
VGLAQALGARFLDADGHELPAPVGGDALSRIHAIDTAPVRATICGTPVIALCDVTTPALDTPGRLGAARLYGPQKGATPADVERLAAGLENLFSRLGGGFGTVMGGGAAGAIGAGLMGLCGATLTPGFDTVARLVGLPAAVSRARLVLTGEGALDAQTREGKVIAGVAALGRAARIPVVAVVGQSRLDSAEAMADLGLTAVLSLAERAGSVARARALTEALLADAAEAAARRFA